MTIYLPLVSLTDPSFPLVSQARGGGRGHAADPPRATERRWPVHVRGVELGGIQDYRACQPIRTQ